MEEKLVNDESLTPEAYRYAPTMIKTFNLKSYAYMSFNYQRYVEEINNTLYYYCCALTLNSYEIPLKMRVKLEYTYLGSFRYLNIDNVEIEYLTELMFNISEQLEILKKIVKRQ